MTPPQNQSQEFYDNYVLGYNMGASGRYTYVGELSGDAREGFNLGKKEGDAEASRYGGYSTVQQFGTPAEQQRMFPGLTPEQIKQAKPLTTTSYTSEGKNTYISGFEVPAQQQAIKSNMDIARQQFLESAKTSPTTQDVARFQQAGYNPQESLILARYSEQTQTTPTKETAKSIISQEKAQEPNFFRDLYNFYNKPLTYATKRILPNQVIENTANIYGTVTSIVSKSFVPAPLYYGNLQKELAKESGEFTKSLVKGQLTDIQQNPIKQVALLGAGYGLGLGFKAGATVLGAIPNIGGVAVGEMASTGFKIGSISYGIYSTAGAIAGTYQQVKANPKEAGSIIGVTAKDLALLGLGFKSGEKGFDILKGEIRTRGLKELNVPQGEFPQAPVNKQLELFQNNIYKEVSNKPVSFHVTPEVFYKEGVITPKAGTSELPGLYTSTQISTPFSRITGSSSKGIDSFEEFKQALSNLFSPEKNPGVAVLEPKGFREVGFKKYLEPIKIIDENKRLIQYEIKYKFIEPPKKGFMDIPKMKSEIEAIARIDAGSYEATGKRFYTKIKGVKVPIDAFKYSEEQLSKNIKEIQNNLQKEFQQNKEFKSSEYSSYKEPSILESPISLSLYKSQSSVSKTNSNISSSIASSIAKNYSELSSQISKTSSAVSGGSSQVSVGSSKSGISGGVSVGYLGGTSKGTSYGSSVSYPQIITPTQPPSALPQLKSQIQKKKSLGAGYNVLGKQLKSNKFFQINHTPLTKERAKDIGSYYVSNTLARTFRIRSAGKQAQEDYEFMGVPLDYFKYKESQLREFKVRKGKEIETPEQFIQRSRFALNTPNERKQIQAFRKQVQKLTA